MHDTKGLKFSYRDHEIEFRWPMPVYEPSVCSSVKLIHSIQKFWLSFWSPYGRRCCTGVKVYFGINTHSFIHGPDCDKQALDDYDHIIKNYVESWCKNVDEIIQQKYEKAKERAEKFDCVLPKKPTTDGKLFVSEVTSWLEDFL